MNRGKPLPTTRWARFVDRLGDWRRTPHLRSFHRLHRNPPSVEAALRRGEVDAQNDPALEPFRSAFAQARRDALRPFDQ